MLVALELVFIAVSTVFVGRSLAQQMWRSRPGFDASARHPSKLWKRLACVLAAGAFTVALIDVEFRFIQPVSPEAAGLLFFLTALPIMLLLFALAFPIFGGALPQIPPSFPAVNIHRRKLSRWLAAGAVLVVITVVAYSAGPASWRENVFVFGCVSVMCASFLLLSAYLKAKWMDYGRTALTLRPWLHWQYSKNEWEQWLEGPATDIPETTLGRDGYLCGDVYRPWVTFGWYLRRATVIRDKQLQIQFTFVDSSYGSGSDQAKLILVPEGREDDLGVLERELRKRLPNAAIELTAES